MGILSLPSYSAGLGQGSPTHALPGTGESGPYGVDAVIEYNGLYLNMRSWIDTYLVTSIDGLHDADIRESREANPAQHGETAFNAYYSGRTITISGRIRAHTTAKLRDMQVALRQAFADVTTERPLILHHADDPTKTYQIYCRKVQPIAMGEAQTNLMHERDFQVSLRASSPRFTKLLPKSVTVDSTKIRTSTNLGTYTDVINEGNFEAQPVFKLANQWNAVQIFNRTTQQLMTLGEIYPDGSLITIDIAKNKITDKTGANKFADFNVASHWIVLAPGVNNIIFIYGSTTVPSNTSATIEWRDTYL